LLGLFMPCHAFAKEWVVQCDYWVYHLKEDGYSEGIRLLAKIYDDDSVDFLDWGSGEALPNGESYEIYNYDWVRRYSVTLTLPNSNTFVEAAKKDSGYECPSLYTGPRESYDNYMNIRVSKDGAVGDSYDRYLFDAKLNQTTINDQYSGGEIPVVEVSDECVRKIRSKMNGYEVNFDFYFRMYTDGSKKLCVAFADSTEITCTEDSRIPMPKKNEHIYHFEISSGQKDKIFVQTTSEQIENNKFSCPSEMYIYQTSVSWGGTGVTSQSYYSITTDKSEAEEYVNKVLTADGTQPEVPMDPGEQVYGCRVIPDEIREWINSTLNLVKYVALALVIVLGILDFIKAAASGESDQMKKSGSSFLKRIIAVAILFLLPLIVELVLNLIEIYGADSTCLPN